MHYVGLNLSSGLSHSMCAAWAVRGLTLASFLWELALSSHIRSVLARFVPAFVPLPIGKSPCVITMKTC
eukprot:scaffold31407_cov39-Attheya_sp.AAC.2